MESEQNGREKVNIFDLLGISDERGGEIFDDLSKFEEEFRYLTDLVPAIKAKYDPESVIMGLFFAEMIFKRDGRLLPTKITAKDVMEFFSEEDFGKIMGEIFSDPEVKILEISKNPSDN